MFNGKAHPVQLLDFNGNDGEMQFNQDVVNDLFLNSKLKDRSVVVFSIVGAFRQGKSFLMNYVLRYLYSNYTSLLSSKLINPDNWLGDEKDPLTGFTWKSGTKRNTTGLVFWSDVFLYETPFGEKIAIYIMDTQGLFDNLTTTADNSKIFSLCTLLSSVQMMNIITTIQENQLQYLQFATSFAKHASNSNKNSKPFQHLLILIRDWFNKDDHSFGLNGGNDFLKDFLMIKENQKEELKSVRTYLPTAFESISCFLMPYPGKTVAQDSKYDGNWSAIEPGFVNSMKELFSSLLSPDNLKTKIINGNVVTPPELLIYIKTYVEQFQSGEIPAAESIYELTLQKQFQMLKSKCVDVYLNFLKDKQIELCDENGLNKLHEEAESAALSLLGDRKKFGSSSEQAEIEIQVKKNISSIFEHLKSVAFVNINRLTEEKEKINKQLELKDLAQKGNDLAKLEYNQVVQNEENVVHELSKTRKANEAALIKIEELKLKLKQQNEAHRIAIENGKQQAELEHLMRKIEAAEKENKLNEVRLQQDIQNQEILQKKSEELHIEKVKAFEKEKESYCKIQQMEQEAKENEIRIDELLAAAKENIENKIEDEQKEHGFIKQIGEAIGDAAGGVWKGIKNFFTFK